MSTYSLITIHKKLLPALQPLPQHLKAGLAIHRRLPWVLPNALQRRIRHRTHHRSDQRPRKVLNYAIGDGLTCHRLNLDKRSCPCPFRRLCQSAPHLNLLQSPLLEGILQSPLDVLVPHMLQSASYAQSARKAGHHCIRQLQLDLAVERIHQLILRFVVREQSPFSNSCRLRDGRGRRTQPTLRNDPRRRHKYRVAFILAPWACQRDPPLLSNCSIIPILYSPPHSVHNS
jgi:hypothetical protein